MKWGSNPDTTPEQLVTRLEMPFTWRKNGHTRAITQAEVDAEMALFRAAMG